MARPLAAPLALSTLLLGSLSATAQTTAADKDSDQARVQVAEAAQLPTVNVTGARSYEDAHRVPASSASVTADDLADKVNVFNTEDALKYLPSLLVRKRYIGDTNAPVATRTTGINASARSIIYADGLLLSTFVGNNNGNGSPQWFLVAPTEIERIDVLYGPYSALYPGNSYGAVVDISTKLPTKLEAGAKFSSSLQKFKQYATDNTYSAYEGSAWLGDKAGAFSWRLSFNFLDSDSQPVTYLTTARSTTRAAANLPVVTGAFNDLNRTGGPIIVAGAGNLTNTQQVNATLKAAYDVTDWLRATYTLGYWQNEAEAGPAAICAMPPACRTTAAPAAR